MSIHNFAFWLSLNLTLGICLAVFLPFPSIIIPLFVLCLAVLLIWCLKNNQSSLGLIILITCFFWPGYFYGFWRTKSIIPLYPEGLINLTGELKNDPQVSNKSQSFFLIPDSTSGLNDNILVYTDLFAHLSSGDKISISGSLTHNPTGQNIIYYPELKIISASNTSSPLSFLFALKHHWLLAYNHFLPSNQAALLAGLTFGDKSGFTTDFKEAMKLSGTTHLVALSGYNITILVSAIGLLFGAFFSRRLTFWLTVLSIIGFVLMVGAEPSIVRAALMGLIALLALRAGRLYSVRNAITISALVMLFISPELASSVGFQLSFLALLGIVYLLPAFTKLFHLSPVGTFLNWRDHLLTTLSAQVAVAPLLLFHFGSLSPFSLISNLLILESVPYAMLLGFLLGFFTWLGSAGLLVTILLSYLVNLILTWQIFIIDLFAHYFTWGTLSVVTNQLIYLFVFYPLLFGFIWFTNRYYSFDFHA